MFVPLGQAFPKRDRSDETVVTAAELESKGYARIGWAMVTYADGDRGDAVNLLRDTAEEHGGEVFQVSTVDENIDGWFGLGVVWRKASPTSRACDPADLVGCTARAESSRDADIRLAAFADACSEKHAPACTALRATALSHARP